MRRNENKVRAVTRPPKPHHLAVGLGMALKRVRLWGGKETYNENDCEVFEDGIHRHCEILLKEY